MCFGKLEDGEEFSVEHVFDLVTSYVLTNCLLALNLELQCDDEDYS